MDPYVDLKKRFSERLLAEPEPPADLRQHVRSLFQVILEEEGLMKLPKVERERLFESVTADIIGFGPLEPLLADGAITEILVMGPKRISVRREDRRGPVEAAFEDEAHVLRIAERITGPYGVRCDESNPLVSLRLPDGSRVTIILRPASLIGPIISIHKSSHRPLTADDLLQSGTLDRDGLLFLQGCVRAGLNILVTGDVMSGKTTLLDVLANAIGPGLIVTIEESPELGLLQDDVLPLQTRPPGHGPITRRQLLHHGLQMRPERIIVDELQGDETVDLLRSSIPWMTTLRCTHPSDAPAELERLYLTGDSGRPSAMVRELIARSAAIIVHVERLRANSRCVTYIGEVSGTADERGITLRPLFEAGAGSLEDQPDGSGLRASGTLSEALAQRLARLESSSDGAELAAAIRRLFGTP